MQSEDMVKVGSKGKDAETFKGDVKMIEDVGDQTQLDLFKKPSKRSRLRRHCASFWLCYSIGAIVLLAVGLPVLFLVIIPKVAQKLVNDADLPIYDVAIMNPQLDFVECSLKTSLKIPKGLSVKLDPLILELYRPEEPESIPFIKIKLPGYTLKGTTELSITNQTVRIDDKNQFTTFLRNAVLNDTFVLGARGKTRAHLGALHADVTLDKQKRLDGLASLRGFDIESATAIFPPEADGTNLRARLMIPNHSIVAFDLGNETLNIAGPNNLHLGTASIQGVYITPGNNTFDASGTVDLPLILNNLKPLLQYWAPALASGNLKLAASGNATVFNGVHIDYYETILNKLKLEGEVSILSLLANSLGNFLGGGPSSLTNLTDYLGLNLTEIGDRFNVSDSGPSSQGNSTEGFLGLNLTEIVNWFDIRGTM